MQNLKSEQANRAYRRALNHTGRKVFTGVKRSLARQVGVTQAVVMKRGALRKRMASNSLLEFRIHSSGEFMPLKDFGPNQQKKGVKAAPWNKRQLFKSTFIVDSLGGHVFKRVGKARLPIEKLYGPSIPREMVRGETAKQFGILVRQGLPARIEHEIKVLTNGVVS